jgi:A/G-specific adenine glycosylase
MVGGPGRLARARIAEALLEWYATNGRRLVLRASRDPHAIWVGEVMSQQTRMPRVGEALPAFLARFPTVAALAAASTGDVVRAWGGLGYPRRAVALRDAAREIVARHGGTLPSIVTELEALPGVGPYTARAIAATAFGLPVTALDVNARRVVGRLLTGVAFPAAARPADQAVADALAPRESAADWNHALMDLGATVCRPVPDCAACPLRRWCRYPIGGSTASWPGPPPSRPAASRSRPFHDTNRHVRGRVLAVLGDASPGAWVTLDPETMAIARERLERAASELAAEGLIELAGPLGARLPLD